MWRLRKSATFEASHVLPNHAGKCARLHGHSWKVTVEVTGFSLQEKGSESGMVMDFGYVGNFLKSLVEQHLDHYHLNDTTELANPTSEALAKWVFDMLHLSIPELSAVTIDETCTSSCEYRP
jgi:6-pyruvoyltetrahydropterin/6-carboxytetrahydropterin synthase